MNQLNFASHVDQRVAVFIDTQNLYHSAKSNHRSNVNYQELIEKAVNGRKLMRAFAYVIKSEENTEEKFFDAIKEIGIEIRVKDLQIFHTGAKKADWDVGIAVDMIRLTEKVDVVVLASGDGDFIEVVRYCKSRGVRVEVMAFEKTTNAKLMEEADYFTDLGAHDAEFLIGNKKRGAAGGSAKATTRRYNGYEKNNDYVEVDYQVSAVSKPTTEMGFTGNSFGKVAEKNMDTMNSPYGGSNLSAVNRQANQNNSVSPRIYGKTIDRKIKPVTGIPAKPNISPYAGKTFVNDQTKNRRSAENAFGNPTPKVPRKKLY